MKKRRDWLLKGFGKKLKSLHAWNAVTILLLAMTGIILYLPDLRGKIADVRVALKQFHIGIGVLSLVILLLYVPLLTKHLKQLRGKRFQQMNLWVILFLLLGWILSGMVLWAERAVPPLWSTVSLFVHDLFSWVGIPWAIYHSISRSKWLKKANLQENRSQQKDITIHTAGHSYEGSVFSRSSFIRFSVGTLLVLLIGPFFYRWLKMITDTGGASIDDIAKPQVAIRHPGLTPLPESTQPIGGGAKGNFRVYTVTDIPVFSDDKWKFNVFGLVEKPFEHTWSEFVQMPRKVQVSNFHCVTGWSVYNCTWEGIPLKEILEKAGVKKEGKYIKFYSGDGVYTDTLTLDQANLNDVMVAVLIDGKPIPAELGGPVRLIVPKMYAYKSVKWLQGIEVIKEEHVGYWEARGYDTDAWASSIAVEPKRTGEN